MKNNELTNSRFGKWGWSMIIYAFLLYYFSTGLVTDGMNLYPDAFQALYGMDRNTLLGFATPAGILGVIGGIVFGRVCVKTGVRKLSGWTLIVTGVLYAVFGFCSTPIMYLIVLAAMSFVSTAYGLICTATLMGNWFPPQKGHCPWLGDHGCTLLQCYFCCHFEHPLQEHGPPHGLFGGRYCRYYPGCCYLLLGA